MPQISVQALKSVAIINGKEYPMYCGFLSAADLREIAEVPSFAREKHHHQIASDIHNPPVDQWQRPLDEEKTKQITAIYSNRDKDNLMANPVLIGTARMNLADSSNIQIEQMTTVGNNGDVYPVEGLYKLLISFTNERKPLWILDGQHRIEGMRHSSQMKTPMPFLLLHDDEQYHPPFLAELFTQVTTGATPMKGLHGAWMQYAFKLNKYSDHNVHAAVETAIHLCKTTTFDTVVNPFHNKIQFNPYQSLPSHGAFGFDMTEWEALITNYYYGHQHGTRLSPEELAKQIVMAIVALHQVDSRKNQGSKFFSPSTHKILAEGFLSATLKHIALGRKKASVEEWVLFYKHPSRQFDKCKWDLPFVKSTNALSSSYAKPSQEIAKNCFDLALNNPTELNNVLLTDFLQGVGAQIRVSIFTKVGKGRRQTTIHRAVSPSGLVPINMKENGVDRQMISISPATANCHILHVTNANIRPEKKLPAATQKGGLDVTQFASGQEIRVVSMSYSQDTINETTLRLDF